MKRFLVVVLPIVAALAFATPVLAAPGDSASYVARCADTMGGQQVGQCAQNMEQGVSTCANAG